jgi:hypothetical protein
METKPSIPFVFFLCIHVTGNKVINTENVAMAEQQCVLCSLATYVAANNTIHTQSSRKLRPIWTTGVSPDFCTSPPIPNFTQIRPVGGALMSWDIHTRTDMTKLVGVLDQQGIQATEADKTKLPSNCPQSIPVRTRSKMLNSRGGVGGLEATSGSARQQIAHILQKPKVQHSVHQQSTADIHPKPTETSPHV